MAWMLSITALGACKGKKDDRSFQFDQIFLQIIDTFIPSDDDPGALDAGFDQSLLNEVRANKTYFQKIFATLQRVHDESIRGYDQAFNEMSLQSRVELITRIMSPNYFDQDARIQITSLRAKTITYFYTSDFAFKMLDYHPPSQGGYPDYDVQPG